MNTNYYHRHLLGIGIDSGDGHKRLTQGEHFHIFGGSQETHEEMQEKTIRLIEKLGKTGKTIVTASDREFYETARELGMNLFCPENN